MNYNLEIKIVFECPLCDTEYKMTLVDLVAEGVPYCGRSGRCRDMDMQLIGWEE